MAAQLYPLRFGVSAASPSKPTFGGITKLESIGGGCFLAQWSPVTASATGMKVYVRQGSSDVFSETYRVAEVKTTFAEYVLKTENDGSTFLTSDNTYYVGVKANNEGTTDDNTTVLSNNPGGSDSYIKVVSGKVSVKI